MRIYMSPSNIQKDQVSVASIDVSSVRRFCTSCWRNIDNITFSRTSPTIVLSHIQIQDRICYWRTCGTVEFRIDWSSVGEHGSLVEQAFCAGNVRKDHLLAIFCLPVCVFVLWNQWTDVMVYFYWKSAGQTDNVHLYRLNIKFVQNSRDYFKKDSLYKLYIWTNTYISTNMYTELTRK
jgi:hypothetical protein